MTGFDDERIRFYMKHRARIEEWAALRGEAGAMMDAWLAELEDPIRQVAMTDDLEFVARVSEDMKYPSFRLARRSWKRDGEDISVSLEWWRGRAVLGGTNSPYVGVRGMSGPLATALKARTSIQDIRSRRKDKTSQWWVAFGYVVLPADFVEHPDAYRDRLIQQLQATWKAYAPEIDAVASR